jgi:hypothetical protein
MTKLLIGLFSNRWSPIWESLKMDNSIHTLANENIGAVLCKSWEDENQSNEEYEMAVFQDTLSDPTDFYPVTCRRFKQIGNSTNEKIRNLFELGFEKGYESVVFVDPILIYHSTNIIDEIQNNWKPGTILFLPDTNGKVALCGMEEAQYWLFDNFDFQEPESIVEILSHCNSKKIPFTVLNFFDVSAGETKWKKAIETKLNA